MFPKILILPMYLILPFTQDWFDSPIYWFLPFGIWLFAIFANALVERSRGSSL